MMPPPLGGRMQFICDPKFGVLCLADDSGTLKAAVPEFAPAVAEAVQRRELNRPVWIAVPFDDRDIAVGSQRCVPGAKLVALRARALHRHEGRGIVRSWYRISCAGAEADGTQKAPVDADVYIYDQIGRSFSNDDAVTAKDFIAELAALPESVVTARVRINSLGGDPFEAIAITNGLREWANKAGRRVETQIDGIAASAASIVIMAGSKIRIADNAMVMIHNPYTIVIGDAEAMQKAAEALAVIKQTIIATYRWHSKLSQEVLSQLMNEETWLSADDAIENGFATEKVEGLKVAASLDRRALAQLNIPDKFRPRVEALISTNPAGVTAPPVPAPPAVLSAADATEVLRLCEEAGCMDLARSFVAAATPLEQVTVKLDGEKRTRAAAQARIGHIRTLCTTSKVSALADGYISSGMTVDDVKAHLTAITAYIDHVEIDGSFVPDGAAGDAGYRPKAALDVHQLYAERNAAHKNEGRGIR